MVSISGTAACRIPEKSYNIFFENVCRVIMGSKQKTQLRRLVNFTFTRHALINLSEERLQVIEYQIQKRDQELLAIPNVE